MPEPYEHDGTYSGPRTVTVPIAEWRSFSHHAPAWWPSGRDFAPPTPSLMRRVNVALARMLAG